MPSALPPVGQARMARLTAQSPSSWSDGARSLLGLRQVGFDFVGEVMGCVAAILPLTNTVPCGYSSGSSSVLLDSQLPERSTASYPKQAQTVYSAALDRLRAEAVARGADGVVAITPEVHRYEGGAFVEVVLRGLAVRARTDQRPARPFLTRCSATEVARLLSSGWVPVDTHVAVEIGVRHDDSDVEQIDQIRSNGAYRHSCFDVPGFTELINRVRASVRTKLQAQVRATTADGALTYAIDVRVRHARCTRLLSTTDRVVRATGWASSLAQFAENDAEPRPAGSVLFLDKEG